MKAMKTIMYFIIFWFISASGVVAGGEKILVWTSIRATTSSGRRLKYGPRKVPMRGSSKGNLNSMSGAARSRM